MNTGIVQRNVPAEYKLTSPVLIETSSGKLMKTAVPPVLKLIDPSVRFRAGKLARAPRSDAETAIEVAESSVMNSSALADIFVIYHGQNKRCVECGCKHAQAGVSRMWQLVHDAGHRWDLTEHVRPVPNDNHERSCSTNPPYRDFFDGEQRLETSDGPDAFVVTDEEIAADSEEVWKGLRSGSNNVMSVQGN